MNSTINIRKAAKDELVQIFELEKEAFAPDHYPLFVLRQWYDIFPELFFLAVDEQNNIKGYCFGGINQEEKVGWVFALAVVPIAQKKGVGKRLTESLITAFKHKTIQIVQLTTTPDNTAAKKLYEKLGFKIVAEAEDYYFDGSPRVIMKLEI